MAPTFPDEKTYLVLHPSRWKYARWYLPAVLFIPSGIFIVVSGASFDISRLLELTGFGIYGFIIMIAGLCLLAVGSISRISRTYYITSHRIIERTGIMNTDENSVNWDRIANYSVIQSATDKMLNIGTIDFDSMTGGGDEDDEVTLVKVANLSKLKVMLEELVTKKETPV